MIIAKTQDPADCPVNIFPRRLWLQPQFVFFHFQFSLQNRLHFFQALPQTGLLAPSLLVPIVFQSAGPGLNELLRPFESPVDQQLNVGQLLAVLLRGCLSRVVSGFFQLLLIALVVLSVLFLIPLVIFEFAFGSRAGQICNGLHRFLPDLSWLDGDLPPPGPYCSADLSLLCFFFEIRVLGNLLLRLFLSLLVFLQDLVAQLLVHFFYFERVNPFLSFYFAF